jgi:hypothetical protein
MPRQLWIRFSNFKGWVQDKKEFILSNKYPHKKTVLLWFCLRTMYQRTNYSTSSITMHTVMSTHVYIKTCLGFWFGKATARLYQRVIYINYQNTYVVLIPMLLYNNFQYQSSKLGRKLTQSLCSANAPLPSIVSLEYMIY